MPDPCQKLLFYKDSIRTSCDLYKIVYSCNGYVCHSDTVVICYISTAKPTFSTGYPNPRGFVGLTRIDQGE